MLMAIPLLGESLDALTVGFGFGLGVVATVIVSVCTELMRTFTI
jgi:hypothetical protein